MPTPEQVLEQMQRPAVWDGWIPTYSGRGYRPWADDPGEIDPLDLAHGLAYTFRYAGHSDPAITVAEHSLLAARIADILWSNRELSNAALMHDASEAFLHDIQGPLRRRVRVQLDDENISWSESDLRVTTNICRQFGITREQLNSPAVRAADILACAFEKRDCWNLGDGDWGLPEIPEEVCHLELTWMSSMLAEQVFLAAMKSRGLPTSLVDG